MEDLEICNWALLKLGQRPCPLESLEGDSITAKCCRLLYPFCHRSLMMSFTWSFVTESGDSPEISKCTSLYQEALAFKLAGELCLTITADMQLAMRLKAEFEEAKKTAIDRDGLEMSDPREY